jgi:catechol 2,3-dioxygenase-like lactoylglutathione lyase family enzyme
MRFDLICWNGERRRFTTISAIVAVCFSRGRGGNDAMNATSTAALRFSLEVVMVPVSDVERALRFYVDQVGFALDVDYAPNEAFRVVQLTPPGSACSIQLGRGVTDAPAGSLRNVYLVVSDLEAVRNILLQRGVKVGDIRHKTPIDAWDGGFASGLDPAHRNYASFADFSDPDGNSWVLQERGYGQV